MIRPFGLKAERPGTMFLCGPAGCTGGPAVAMPNRPGLWGLWNGTNYIILGAEEGSGVYDMPHCFFSRKDAEDWKGVRRDFAGCLVVAMNEVADRSDKEQR